ncbi:MAG: HAMP domain-containing protein [Candidatus Omnitrophica bacterium]|nr:HAMP domain-containing protein [Candidatus Omnitrophota bacterium]
MKNLIQKSFSRKLVFAYVFVFAAVFLLAGWFSASRVEKEVLSNLELTLKEESLQLARTVAPLILGGTPRQEIHEKIRALGSGLETRITVIDSEGLVLGDSERTFEELRRMDNHASRPEIKEALEKRFEPSIRYSHTLKTNMLYVAVPVFDEDPRKGILRTALPLTRVNKIIQSAKGPIQAGMLFGTLVVILLSIFLGSRMTARIRQLTRVARQYAQGDFGEKIRIDSQDELKVLADAMNFMAKSLKERISELETERNKISAILENMTEGVIAVDGNLVIFLVNRNVEEMLQVSSGKMIGKNFAEVAWNQKLMGMMELALKDKTSVSGEIELVHKDKKIVKANAIGFESKRGERTGILVLYDMTQIRRLEKVRSEFLANVSHELKTPLTSIKGFVETLLGGALKDPERAGSFLQMMKEDSDRLTRLIEDLLELSSIESKEEPLQAGRVELKKEVDRIVKGFEQACAEKKIKVENRVAEGISFSADPDKIRQVLVNLLDNAVKFNRENGSVMVDAILRDNFMEVRIEDTGIGIPESSRERIFERFYRVDKARSRALGGTGLGLSIVKHIIEAHGGTVSCQSREGKGSTFILRLPVD